MLKKVLLGVVLLVVALSAGLFFWARAVFGQDTVRTALAAQLSKALGQPVTIGSVGAKIYPRLAVDLGTVAIGQPGRLAVETLSVGTDFRALLSRRIEHASLNLSGARIELPLPEFAFTSGATDPSAGAPVEIVSIDEIVLRDVEIVSGGRTLRGDVELVPQGTGVTVRRVSLTADGTTIEITGRISDLAGPAGELTAKAAALDFDQLLAFVSDFSAAAVPVAAAPAPAQPSAASPAMNLVVALAADRATMGGLTLEALSGSARVTPAGVTLEPIGFGLFGGRYDGSLAVSLGATPDFRLLAMLSGIDMAAATAFAGSPDTITGRLAGRIDLEGNAADMTSARGTVSIDITDGTVKNLGLVQTIIVATSGRGGSRQAAAGGSRDEPFTRMGGTLSIARGTATTNDLKLESRDLLLALAGTIRLDASAMNLKGQVQLSEALSQQAGRDLVRYTQDQGRVTLPATITGPAASPRVGIDVGSLARRALTNKANEEAQKAVKKGLGGLLGR